MEREREGCSGSTSLRKDLSAEGRVVKQWGTRASIGSYYDDGDRDDVMPRVPRLFIDDSLSGRSTSFTRARSPPIGFSLINRHSSLGNLISVSSLGPLSISLFVALPPTSSSRSLNGSRRGRSLEGRPLEAGYGFPRCYWPIIRCYRRTWNYTRARTYTHCVYPTLVI